MYRYGIVTSGLIYNNLLQSKGYQLGLLNEVSIQYQLWIPEEEI